MIHASPDGETPRAFAARVAAFVGEPSHDAMYCELEAELQAWAAKHERLGSAVARSALLAEIGSVSKALSDIADVGLRCLGALHAAEPMTREERESHIAVLELAGVPIAEVTLAVIPGIRALLEAVPGDTQIAQSMRRKEVS